MIDGRARTVGVSGAGGVVGDILLGGGRAQLSQQLGDVDEQIAEAVRVRVQADIADQVLGGSGALAHVHFRFLGVVMIQIALMSVAPTAKPKAHAVQVSGVMFPPYVKFRPIFLHVWVRVKGF